MKQSWEYGQVVVSERHEFAILQADDEILVSLELLPQRDPRGLSLDVDELCFGSGIDAVRYRVTGWHPDARALIAERIES